MSQILLGVNKPRLITSAPAIIIPRMGDLTRLSDVIVPEMFSGYTQNYTTERSRLIQSGALVMSPQLTADLNGAGLIFQNPFFKDLDREDEENISTDSGPDSVPNKITTGIEKQVRLSRNNSWGSADLVAALIGRDPMQNIINLVGGYWVGRLQRAWIATMRGVFANNALATDAYHVQNDMTYNISGTAFVDGQTNFSASAFILANGTMGDRLDELSMVMVHSVVYQRMQLLNLIDFIPDARGEVMIATYMGKEVIVDDMMPNSNGVYESWIVARGATAMGASTPKVPTAIERKEAANNGAGEEVLHNRVEWILHPVGMSYIGDSPAGGPSNAATTNNLANGNSWRRAAPERKQIKIARLVTREFAAV